MTNKPIDAIGLVNQAKAERSEFLIKILGDALVATMRAVRRSMPVKKTVEPFTTRFNVC